MSDSLRLISIASYGLASVCSLVFFVLLVVNWRRGSAGLLALLAVLLGAVVFFLSGWSALFDTDNLQQILAVDFLRTISWVALLLGLLKRGFSTEPKLIKWAFHGAYLVVFLVVFIFLIYLLFPQIRFLTVIDRFPFFVLIVVNLVILWLVEQLYRNSEPLDRGALKYLCLGVLVWSVFDTMLYVDTFLFSRMNPSFWATRGFVYTFSIPLLAVAITRNPQWNVRLFVSRQAAFFSASLLVAGGYLLLTAIAGYLMRSAGGEWAEAVSVVIISLALIGFFVVSMSERVKAEIKYFITTHFYQNKYDYREQWLKFTKRLAGDGSHDGYQLVLTAFCETLNSPGGVLWVRRPSGLWFAADSLEWGAPPMEVDFNPLVEHLGKAGLAAREVGAGSESSATEQELVPAVVTGQDESNWWMVLLPGSEQVVLQIRPSVVARHLDAEDKALLVVLADQAGAYLSLVHANHKLAETRQFEAYNRLSAFLVHDLKNIVAQLKLITANSDKHLNNPEFVNDAFRTVDSAAARIDKVLQHLRNRAQSVQEELPQKVNLKNMLMRVVESRAASLPKPELQFGVEDLFVNVVEERLENVLNHLIQNAQEATGDKGLVNVRVSASVPEVVDIEIEDSGCGMSTAFVNRKLFKPFVTTKGNSGMGIGMYESKQFLESAGGTIRVRSVEGKGTTVSVQLPLA